MFVAIHSNHETRQSRIVATGDQTDCKARALFYMYKVWAEHYDVKDMSMQAVGAGVEGESVWCDIAFHAFSRTTELAVASVAVYKVEHVAPGLLEVLGFADKGADFNHFA